jgi:hypothetical protein
MTRSMIRVELMKKILLAVLLIGIGWLFSGVGNFSLNACNHFQDRLGELQIAFGAR